MSHIQSEFAITELQHLDTTAPQTDVVLSFEERQGIRVAAWAASKFGADVLVNKVVHDYNQHPETDDAGRPVHLEDLGGQAGIKLKYELEEAEMLGQEIADDLTGAVKRVERGYPMMSFTVRGATDATAIIGSLERAVEVNPENLSEGDRYYQAAAGHILNHMQVLESDLDNSVAYLL